MRCLTTVLFSIFYLTKGFAQFELDCLTLEKFINTLKVVNYFHATRKVEKTLVMIDPLNRFEGHCSMLTWDKRKLLIKTDSNLVTGTRFFQTSKNADFDSSLYVLRDFFKMRDEYFITVFFPYSNMGASGKIIVKGKRFKLKYVDFFAE